MSISVPTQQELVSFIQDALTERAGITNFSESSVAGTLANVMAAFVSDIYSNLAEMENRNSLSTAYGPYLDRIGELYGVTRRTSRAATTIGAGKSVLFSNPTTEEKVIAAHTRIWARNSYNLAYYTTDQVTVPAADGQGVPGQVYADVTAIGNGEVYNAAPGILTEHNAGSQLLKVTNVRAISNGTDVESDDNYRYRIQNAILSRQGNNEMTLRSRLLELPSIRNVVIRPLARGTGTVDVTIVPVDRYVSGSLLEQAQEAAEEAVPLGVSVKVSAPIERPVDIELQLVLAPSTDVAVAKALVSSAVRGYIDNLGISEDAGDSSETADLIISQVIAAAQTAGRDVRSVNISRLKVDNKSANLVDQRAQPGEMFYLQSIKVM